MQIGNRKALPQMWIVRHHIHEMLPEKQVWETLWLPHQSHTHTETHSGHNRKWKKAREPSVRMEEGKRAFSKKGGLTSLNTKCYGVFDLQTGFGLHTLTIYGISALRCIFCFPWFKCNLCEAKIRVVKPSPDIFIMTHRPSNKGTAKACVPLRKAPAPNRCIFGI